MTAVVHWAWMTLLLFAAVVSGSTIEPLFTGLNHVSRECRDPEKMADFYTSLLGFSRVPAPKFEFKTIWIQHPSGLMMHLIEGTPDFRLAEGPARDAETGQRVPTPFAQGKLDPIHIRRGHHLAFNVRDLAAVKAELDKRGIPYGTSQVPGSPVQQAFFHDVEGNGVEAVYRPPVSEEL